MGIGVGVFLGGGEFGWLRYEGVGGGVGRDFLVVLIREVLVGEENFWGVFLKLVRVLFFVLLLC